MQIFKFATARMKINQIPYVIFWSTSQFFLNYCITRQCHDILLLCIFLAQTLYILVKVTPLRWNVWDFWVLGQNSPHSSCRFSKHKSVPPKILHYSSVLWHITPLYLFGSNIIHLWQIKHIKEQTFRFAAPRIKIHQILHVIFEIKSRIYFKLCIFLQCHET